MLNHITIMGRLTRDPELRRTGSGIAVASFTVAVDRDFAPDGQEKETDFIDCVAWRQTGEFVSKYFSKGSMIVVSGRLQLRNWTDKDGNKRRTPILTALLEAECFDSVTVMVQKEVAQRIAAKPGSADYSAFTVFCQYYAEPELLFDVPAHCFLPQPKVTSAIISLRVRKQRNWDILDQDVFFRTVRASFAMRRKKLSNGLASGFPELGKTGAAEVIAAAGFDANVRGETLSIPEFARIANEIVKRKNQ